MICVGIGKIDQQGRILIGDLFRGGADTPKNVQLVIDIDREMIEIIPEDDAERKYGKPSILDEKGRVVIPKWIREELDERNEFLFIIDDNRLFLSPKTGKII